MKWFAAIAAAAALAAAGVPGADGANTLCVGNRPACYPTLRGALLAAADGDTIAVDAGYFAGDVTVQTSVHIVGAGRNRTFVWGGGPVITIGSASRAPNVSIDNLTITGGRATNGHPGTCGPDVPICGPGYPDATAIGGGIEAYEGTTTTLTRVAVTGNRAVPAIHVPSVKATCPTGPCPASFGDAAGIDNRGTMTLRNSVVSENYAAANQSNGGGIVNQNGGTLTILDSAVTGNSANAAPPTGRFVQGGGIWTGDDTTLTVRNSTISDNAATLRSSIPHPYPQQDGGNDQQNAVGGGIFATGGATVDIRDSTLDGNEVTIETPFSEPFAADAAIAAWGGPLTLLRSQLSGNSVDVHLLSTAENGGSGGVVEVDGDGNLADLAVRNNQTSVAAVDGPAAALGAVQFLTFGGSNPVLARSLVVRNSVTAVSPNGPVAVQGAGVVNAGTLLLADDVVAANRANAFGVGGFAQGGGIWNGGVFGDIDTSPLTLQRTHVLGNSLTASPGVATQGGGIYTQFPISSIASVFAGNTPDNCFGC